MNKGEKERTGHRRKREWKWGRGEDGRVWGRKKAGRQKGRKERRE